MGCSLNKTDCELERLEHELHNCQKLADGYRSGLVEFQEAREKIASQLCKTLKRCIKVEQHLENIEAVERKNYNLVRLHQGIQSGNSENILT